MNNEDHNDKIKALKEQALDWIEKELSYNPEHVPKGIEDAFLEENWDFLEEVWGVEICYPGDIILEPLTNILQEIQNEV